MLDCDDYRPCLSSRKTSQSGHAEEMNSPIWAANEELAWVPPTLIVKFLLYCSMGIVGLALLLFLLAALRSTAALVLDLASGVLIWLMYLCVGSLNKLREYAYMLASEKLGKRAAVNRPLTQLPTTRTLTVFLWTQGLGVVLILAFLVHTLTSETIETERLPNLLWLALNATWLFLVIRGLDSLENLRNFAIRFLSEQPEEETVRVAKADDDNKLSAKASLIMLFFPRRIGGLSYFIRSCASGLVAWGIVGWDFVDKPAVTRATLLLPWLVYHLIWVVLPRMRDLSMRTSRVILILVPIINVLFGLVLMFRPSAINRAGSTVVSRLMHDALRAYVTSTLIILNVIIFGLMVMSGVPVLNPTALSLMQWGANFGPLTLGGQWWRMLSALFLHFGVIHLLLNMFFLANIGSFIEKVFGKVAYLTLYLVAGIAGVAAALAWHPFAVGAGASGAILGLYGALLAVFLRCRKAVPAETWGRLSKGMTAFVGCSLFYGFFRPEIATDAHLGGLVSGFLLGLFLAQPIPQEAVAKRRWRTTVAGISGAALVVATVLTIQLNPKLAYISRAYAMAQKGDLEGAVADYDRVIQLDPKLAEAYISRADAKNRQGNLDGAIADCDQAIQLNPKFALAYGVRGRVQQSKGNLDRAIADYSQAIQFDPKLAEVYSARGTAKAVKGDLDGAIADCNRAIQLNPKLTVAHSILEFAKARTGARDGAIAASGSTTLPGATVQPSRNPPGPLAFLTPSAIIATPSKPMPIPTPTPRVGSSNAQYYDDRGFRYYQQKNYEKAMNDFDEAIRLNPDYARAYNRRGLVYYQQKNYDKAINDFDEAIRLDPDYTHAYNNRGLVYYQQKNYEKAINDFDEAIRLDPKYAHAYNNRGLVYYHQKNYEKAINEYNEAIRLDRNFTKAYRDRGDAFKDQGENEKAEADFLKAAQVESSHIRSIVRLDGVAVTVGDLHNPYFAQIVHGAEVAAKKINPSVKFTAESSDYDVNKETNQMDNFVSSGVNLILLYAADAKGIAPAVMRAKAAGIIVVAVTQDAEGVDATVYSNHRQAGQLDGKYVGNRLNGRGRVVIVNGPPKTAVTDRVAGFLEEIKKYPDIKILSQDQNAAGSRGGGLWVMTHLLAAFPKIDAVFAINDPTAMGCDLAAKQAQRKEFFIVGVDGSPGIVPFLRDPDSLIAASAAEDPYAIGGKAVGIANDILNGKKPEQPLTLIPVDLITKENVYQYEGWTK
jgi:ribose transport system substrate-binding protein